MDNLGAIGGPLLALALVAAVGVRTAILLSVIPGLLAVVAIVYAIRHTPKPTERDRRRLAFKVRPVLQGRLGRFLSGVTLFEAANMAATLMILRATDQLTADHGYDRAVEIAIVLYVLYNVTATIVSVPGGHVGDRRGMVRVFGFGIACFALAYGGLAIDTESIVILAVAFAVAGVGIGLVETAEHAAVATFARDEIRGSAFGLLAAIQSFGNLAASAIVGLLYTFVSPSVAFGYASAIMIVALVSVTTTARRAAS